MGSNGKKGKGGARAKGRDLPTTEAASPGAKNGAGKPHDEDDGAAAAGADPEGGEASADDSPSSTAPVVSDVPPRPDPPAPAATRAETNGGRASAPTDPAAPPAPAPPRRGAAWAEPFARFERRWTLVEQRLITFVLLAQILAMVSWVFLNGLSEPVSAGESAGTVFRCLLGALILGVGAFFFTRKRGEAQSRTFTIAAILLGLVLGPLWRGAGVGYFSNLKGWLQEGSTLTLVGGLPGLATRFTLWLALLGGSLATGAGKHIHIDVVYRFLPNRLRVPASLINYAAAATMCFAGVWGFVDHIAIDSFNANADLPAGRKIAVVEHEVGNHLFYVRKQLGLDLRSVPHVVAGEPYDRWLTGAAWNAWVRDAGFEDHGFTEKQIAGLVVPEDGTTHTPFIIAPDSTETRGVLVHSLGLVIPFGLFAIGLRFLLRMLLTLSGHLSVDPDEAHKEDLHTAHTLADVAAKGGA
jgi:hypothetical protein